jgi:hypothetical protein
LTGRKNDEERRDSGVDDGNGNDVDDWAGERHTDLLSPPRINRFERSSVFRRNPPGSYVIEITF